MITLAEFLFLFLIFILILKIVTKATITKIKNGYILHLTIFGARYELFFPMK